MKCKKRKWKNKIDGGKMDERWSGKEELMVIAIYSQISPNSSKSLLVFKNSSNFFQNFLDALTPPPQKKKSSFKIPSNILLVI